MWKPPQQYMVRGDSGHEHNANILKAREGGLIIPNPAITPQTVFDGQPVTGVPVFSELLNMYDLTVRQAFEAPFDRTLVDCRVVGPAWSYAGLRLYPVRCRRPGRGDTGLTRAACGLRLWRELWT